MAVDLPALLLEGKVLAGIVGFLLLGAIGLLVLRTRALPGCWNCGLRNVRRAHSRRVLDSFARAILLRPYRCESCLRRFYGFRTRRVPRESHTWYPHTGPHTSLPRRRSRAAAAD